MEMKTSDFTKLPDYAISTFTLRGKVYLASFNQINEVANLELYEINANGNQTLRWIQQMNLKSYFLSSELYFSSFLSTSKIKAYYSETCCEIKEKLDVQKLWT